MNNLMTKKQALNYSLYLNKSKQMRQFLYLTYLFFGCFLSAQVITDKDGYSIDVTNFETIEVYMSTNALKRVKVVGDGYDEVFLNNGAQIQDGKRIITDKVPDFIKREAFWTAFLKRCGFQIQDAKTEKKVNKTEVAKYLPGANAKETKLVYTKSTQ